MRQLHLRLRLPVQVSIVDGLETNKTTVKATAQENGKVTFSMVAKGTGTLTPNNFA